MSKIPRSFVTPTSKAPVGASASLEHAKPSNIKKIALCSLKKVPLSELVTEKRNIDTYEKLPFSKKSNAPLKRNATTNDNKHPLPSKQIKLSNKGGHVAPKIAPYDYKARFNDLSEKHKELKLEYSESKEKLEECADELEMAKSSLESNSIEYSTLSAELKSLSCHHKSLNSQYEEMCNEFELNKKHSSELSINVECLENEVLHLKKELKVLKPELEETKSSLLNKSHEYNSLKVVFEREVSKCSQLSSTIEENQVKMLSYTSEITFMKARQNILERKSVDDGASIANLERQVKDLTAKLSVSESRGETLQRELDEKTSQYYSVSNAYNLEVQKCQRLNTEVANNTKIILSNNIEIDQMKRYNEALQSHNDKQSQEISNLEKQNAELDRTVETMYDAQKALRNTIQDLKGHIRVFCRIRPSLDNETSKPLLSVDVLDSCTMEVDKTTVGSVSGLSKKQSSKHNFTFDGIFPPNSPQSEVFTEVASLIQSALDGYNVCIFAYGQTGSGKTYTMEGGPKADGVGIIPRAIDLIFSNLSTLKKMGWVYTIKASFLEIYNENIYDLLDSKKDQEEHSIKMVDSKGCDVYVSNIKEETVSNSDYLKKLLAMSQKNRQTAATICNERSSRSHSIMKIKISAFHEKRKEKYSSSLNLVDLAGSESAKTSQRMDETKSINKSLSELSKVILALQSKQSHVPYRNSKLTYLLMPCLGGNSKTLMLVNIAQFDECYQETLNSLRFAAKVNSCRSGVTKKNISTV